MILLHDVPKRGEEFVACRKHAPPQEVVPFTRALGLIAAGTGTANVVGVDPNVLASGVLAFRSDRDTMISGYDDDRVQRSAILTGDLINGALKRRVSIACDDLIDHIL